MSNGPLAAYRAKMAAGQIKPDPAQELAAEKLQSLHHALLGYQPAAGEAGEAGWRARFGLGLAKRKAEEPPPPRGLYIFGEVGRGKSMLMDLFYESSSIPKRKRVHFHAFMRDIHAQIHQWRQSNSKEADPLPRLAKTIIEEAWLLCFDELQVLDIADAMILARLFQALWDNGAVIVFTSNRPPDDLYKDGLQRERFLPFIKLLKEKTDVLELNSEQDYRLGRKRGMRVYHSPLNQESAWALEEAFSRLTGGLAGKPGSMVVQGRTIPVPLTADGVARFTFEDLCARPLGAADYLALATLYHTVIIDFIPVLGPNNRDQAKRFVTLVDALYEHKVTLVCAAAAPPEALYPEGDGAFEFQRTVSRLMEMQAEDYIGRQHLT